MSILLAFLKRIKHWLTADYTTGMARVLYRITYHVMGWLAYILFFLWYQNVTWHTLTFVLSNELVKLAFLGAGVYFNILYLIPIYLSEKKYITYVFLMIMTAILITPLEVFVLFFKLTDAPDYQLQIVDNQLSLYVFNLFAITTSTLLKIVSDWLRHQRIQKELERRTLRSELDFLRTQINPHFLFNTLNSLYALTLKKSDNAPEIVIKLSDMMRYMLYESNVERVSLAKEVEYMQHYVDLEMLRFGKKADIKFEIVGEIHTQEIAPLLFQTFLENAFKHGLSNAIERGFIDFHLSVNDNLLHLDLKNSVPPTLPDTQKRAENAVKSSGIGLVNVRRRLELLYKEHYELIIKQDKISYNVHLTIEL
jgi:two-component system, LytTR family, sensor kinase